MPRDLDNAYSDLWAHYCQCKICGQVLHSRVGELCPIGRELHDKWEREFLANENLNWDE